ncbi:twitchin-like isoform X3 [Haliotis cracherodii]|uniref:twitchin-like isoform X3 n=1 Tax=Haliotis cracherodii TaxID=6455 RepID=UPI0039EA4EAA
MNDTNSNNSSSRSGKAGKGKQRAYQKKPTTILEEDDEEHKDDGYEADVDRPVAPDISINDYDEDDGKAGEDDGRRMSKSAKGKSDGPFLAEKPGNVVVQEGKDLMVKFKLDLQGKPLPSVRIFRAGREVREDTRTSIVSDKNNCYLEIKKTRIQDEAKYSVVLEQNGMKTDEATFSVFIKDPKDSALDFRSLLKHRDTGKKEEEDDSLDWGNLKPVDKKGRRLSQIEMMRKGLKKVEKAEGSDSEEEKQKDSARRQSVELEAPVKKVSAEKLEALEQQTRRASMQTRRASLAECIPDWPTLSKRHVIKEEPDKFLKELDDVKCMEGKDRVTFSCEFCKPNAKVRWFKNKMDVFHGHKYHLTNDDHEYKLELYNVKPEDGGKYTCQCNNATTSGWLYVEAKEPEYYFTQKLPQHHEITRKKMGMLECFISDPRARVKWYKGDEALEYTPGIYEIQRRENRCILKFPDAQSDLEGEYTCRCGDAITSCDLYVEEPEWEFMKKLEDVEAVEREKATFTCDVSDPEAEVSWFKDEKELKAGGKFLFEKDGLKRRLVVKNCSIKDDAKYSCHMLNQITAADLFVSPDVRFMKKLENKTVKEGENLVLECKAANPHKHPVKWFKNGQPIGDDVRIDITQKGESFKLTIKGAKPTDEAEYKLQIGERPTKSVVTVQEQPKPPKIDPNAIPKEIFVKRGERIELDIPFVGAPLPRAQWSKDGQPLSEADLDIETSKGHTKLIIPDAQRTDTGTYELVLTNEAGSDKIPVKITVMDKPGKPKGPLDVTDIYADRCALLWDKPKDDGGAPITHYLVEKMDSATGKWEPVCETDDMEVDVSDLTPGHKYQFRVAAVNSEGTSEYLDSDGEILAKDPWDPSDPPGTPEIIDYDKDYAEIKFDPPKKDGGAPIQSYAVEYREKGTDEWKKGTDVPGTADTATVEGLKEGKEYEFRVKAKNKAGLSEGSECSGPVILKSRRVKPRINHQDVTKKIQIKAGQPFSIPITFIGEPAPKATWTVKGLMGPPGSAGTEIPLEPSDVVAIKNEPKKSTVDNNKSIRKHTGLYTITVANKHGQDTETVEVVVLGPPSRPSGPLAVKDVTKDSATLTWKPPPDDGGNDITNYRVEKFDMKKGKWEKVADAVGKKCVVPKLQEGHEYKFRVIAENRNGESEPLETEDPVTAKNPFDEPLPPGQPQITDTDRNRIEMKWDPPEDDGGAPVTSYDIERKDPKSGRWVKINKAPVEGNTYKDDKVSEGKEYEYRVIANNEAGSSEPSHASKPAIAKPTKEAPKVSLDNLFGAKEIRVRAGEPLDIALGILGAPAPTVEWLQNGKPVGDRARKTNTETEAKLNIPRSVRGDTGKYTIKVKNAHGEDCADVNVVVLDKPAAPDGPLDVAEVTAETCRLKWKPPTDNGGAEVTGYIIEKCEEGSTLWEKVPGLPTGTSHLVKGLKEGKTYQFRVKAENIYGTGEPLIGNKVLAKNPFDAPDAPRDLAIAKYDKFSCTLEWKPPLADGGNPITGYVVEKKERGRDWVKASSFPIPDPSFTVLNLKEGNDVEFRVMAVNEAGPGKPSKSTPPHTVRDPIFPAGSPTQPNVDKITKNSVGLSWNKPTSDGGSKITGYIVERKKKGEDDWTECLTLPASVTQGTVGNLKEGDEYSFRIRAENAAGPGEPSRPTNVLKVEDQPEKPKMDMTGVRDITVKAGQEFQIKIPFVATPKPKSTWKLGDDEVEESARTTFKILDGKGHKLGEDVAVLAVAKSKREDAGQYSLTLKNPSGSETVHLNVNVLDKPKPPKGPITASDVDGESMTLNWQAPVDTGGEPIANYIVEKRKAGSNRWQKVSSFVSSPKCTVRNLEPGEKYEFRIMAENTQGVSEPLETEEAILSKLPYDPPSAPSSPKSIGTTEDSITLSWNPPKRDGGAEILGYQVEKREKGDNKWTKANVSDIGDTEYTVKGLQEGKDYEFRVCAVNAAGPGEHSECSDSIKAQPPPVAPKINRDFGIRDIVAKVGEPFKISIPFNGRPIPTAAWTQGGLTVHETDRIKFRNDPTEILLLNKKAEKGDTGKYTVLLTNEKGSDSISLNVTVFDAPCKPEGPLDVSEVTPDSCILKWSPPKEDGGSPISNYIVEKQDKKTGKWEPVTKFVRGTTYEVMGLTEGHEYNFRVSAENEHGISEPLETTMSVCAQYPYTAPDAPSTPEVLDVDDGSVTLSWARPKNDGGKKIQGFVIEYKEPSSGRWKTYNEAPIKETTTTLEGLKKDGELEFRVRAKNSAGLGEPSSSTGPVLVKPKYTKPSVPGVPSPAHIGRSFVELKWDKPRLDGGSKITGYIVEKREKGSTYWTKATDYPCIDNAYTVANLPENAEFEFRVIAVNAAGKSEPSLECAPIKIKEKVVGSEPDFIKKLQNVKAALGGEASFNVEFKSEPKPEIYWFKNGIEMGSSGRNRMRVDGSTCTFTIGEVYDKDAGDITCELVNSLGRVSCSCNLAVLSPPRLEKDIRDQKVEKGEQFKIKIPFSGTGPFDVKIKRDNKDVPESDRIKISVFDEYMTLIIKDSDIDDTGAYKVEISNDSGTCTAPFKLKVVSPPYTPTGPLNVSDITKHTCRLAWKPPKEDGGAKVTSYVVERQEVGKPYWVTVSSQCRDTSLDVQGLYENSQYLFRVSAVNEFGQGEPLTAESAIVAKMPFDAPQAPGTPEVTEVGGDFVSLTWDKPKSDGGGRIHGYWIDKREHGTDNWSRINMSPCLTNMINIPNLIEDRKYEFRVFAENEAGLSKPSMASSSVKIKDPKAAVIPEFTSGLRKVQAVQGKSARFECEVSGTPKPDIQWFKGVREVYDSDKFEVFTEGDKQVLVVHDVFGEDADEYTVRATNRGGSRASRAELEIRSPPKINVPPRFRDICTFEKGETCVLKIPFMGNPKPDVKWIRDGEELRGSHYNIEVTDRHAILTIKDATKNDDGPYRLQLENSLGQDSVVLKLQVNDHPDSPRFPKVENIRDDSVVLSWKPPLNDGGSFITAYVVEKRELPSNNWIRSASTRFEFHNVTGLSANKEYEFRVVAENFYGRSEPCEPTTTIKTDEPESVRKKKQMEDEFGRKVRGKYDGPKINDYDKFYDDIWKKFVPQPVTVKQASVYDYYDILEELGSGAFGVVHRCVEKATGRVFVAKFINSPYPLDKATVKNEINIMNQLHHPKLINMHDAFEDKYEMVLILEFLAGGELFDRIAAEDYKMSEAEVINYMRQACEGLKHMHEHSIVHLDIKPENIMVETKKSTNVKIIDFGLATKLNPDEIVKVTTATAEFAAPEIVDREPVGFYTDMWAIGVLAYVLLSGLSPFAGEDDLETLQNVKRCDWDFDEEAFSNVSQEAKAFIKALLVKQAPKRMNVHDALEHPWLTGDHSNLTTRIPSSRYNKIRQRIKERYADWPQPMPAIGRIANFSSLRKHRPKEYQIYDSYFDRKEAVPRFVRRPRNATVPEGQTCKFDCKIIAASPPIVTWYKNDSLLTQSIKYMQKYMGNEFELKISRVKMEDKGEILVRAENSFGRKEEKCKLNIEPGLDAFRPPSRETTPMRKRREFEEVQFEKPKEDEQPNFNFDLRPRTIQAGTEFKLICCVKAHPPPKVQWSKDGRDLTDGDHYNITYSHGVCTLEIQNARVEDTGRYSCVATNPLGDHETNTRVTVEDRVHAGVKDSDSSSKRTVSRMARRTKSGVNIEEFSSSYEESSSSTSSKSSKTRRFQREEVTESSSSSSSSSRRKEEKPVEVAPEFSEKLSPVSLTEGERLALQCTVTAKPEPNVEWYFNGQMLKSDDVVSLSYSNGVCKLVISDTVIDDEGTYVCKASNPAGVASTRTNVTIKGKATPSAPKPVAAPAEPESQPAPVEATTPADTPAPAPESQPAPVESTPSADTPAPEPETPASEPAVPETAPESQPQTMTDPPTADEPESEPSQPTETENPPIVEAPGSVQEPLSPVQTEESAPAPAPAPEAEAPAPTPEAPATQPTGGEEKEPIAPAPEKKSDVEVPSFLDQVQGQIVLDGDQVTFQCRISGNPEVQWLRDGKTIKDCEDFQYGKSGDSYKLVMAEVFPEDSGVYECVATNASGSISSAGSLLVQVPDEKPVGPVFVTFPKSQNAEEGSSVKLSCSVESQSSPTVSWSRAGREIEDTGRFKFTQDGNNFTFEIPAVLSTDSGAYTVKVKDDSGCATWAFSLHVAIGESAGGDVDVQQFLKSVA